MSWDHFHSNKITASDVDDFSFRDVSNRKCLLRFVCVCVSLMRKLDSLKWHFYLFLVVAVPWAKTTTKKDRKRIMCSIAILSQWTKCFYCNLIRTIVTKYDHQQCVVQYFKAVNLRSAKKNKTNLTKFMVFEFFFFHLLI